MLVRLIVSLGATALGLVIAGALVVGLSVGWREFVAVVIIAALQSVLAVFYVRPVASLGPSGHEPLRPCDTGTIALGAGATAQCACRRHARRARSP
ncbi:hypothetical protein [Sanguibacter massiliensis]|uniref:hypothetical protein n=1 Tax=Sanguibacter massiliensis TaxID=1973217 RepID=UPI00101AD320|nr:hypothetical protein [Sanguibacter massiliensis]